MWAATIFAEEGWIMQVGSLLSCRVSLRLLPSYLSNTRIAIHPEERTCDSPLHGILTASTCQHNPIPSTLSRKRLSPNFNLKILNPKPLCPKPPNPEQDPFQLHRKPVAGSLPAVVGLDLSSQRQGVSPQS